MPVRFRCPHCNRLLGIASRKAGSQISCPQCSRPITVPSGEKAVDLDEIDLLVNPAASGQGLPPSAALPQLEAAGAAPVSTMPPPTRPSPPAAAPSKPAAPRETPLLERDVDALLGLDKGLQFDLDEEPQAKTAAVSGMDAMSLGDEPHGLVLSPQKATLLGIAVLVLLGIAFAAGFLTASNL